MKIYRIAQSSSEVLERRNDKLHSDPLAIPAILYHATFRPYLEDIKLHGIRSDNQVKMNYDMSKKGVVYLARYFEEAESYAETSESVPSEWIPEKIVVLAVNTSMLDKNLLAVDENVLFSSVWGDEVAFIDDNLDEEKLFEYYGVVHPFAITNLGML